MRHKIHTKKNLKIKHLLKRQKKIKLMKVHHINKSQYVSQVFFKAYYLKCIFLIEKMPINNRNPIPGMHDFVAYIKAECNWSFLKKKLNTSDINMSNECLTQKKKDGVSIATSPKELECSGSECVSWEETGQKGRFPWFPWTLM